ncbi:MAG: beta-glucosidase-like glycosyl hydrolase [Chitinophagaceae bacterium]|nr:beta-glucosidase-like glycosyl hydrolase [Chitinophagaceae bacterium]
MRNLLLGVFALASFLLTGAQDFYRNSPEARHWVDSTFNTLSPEQKIAQLMIIRAHSNLGQDHVNEVTDLINKYNIGGLCFFQGGPVRQAKLTNYYQSIAKTPLMVCIDGEWGLGMRLDSVINYPRQLMMGAVPNAELVYQFGKAVGEQCKRIGVTVNYAPDIDINNNPQNPVINDRSFGEDKYKVALFGTQYMKGMQEVGVMACAKHFPGHGDVAVDSHLDLPVINKSRAQLDALELYPFRELIKQGVGSMMIAHLYVPSIDPTPNQATSLSRKTVTGLLREELGYSGLTFTDALEMQGVAKYYPAGEAAVQSLIAGNDMLCLPGDVPGSIEKVLAAIKAGKLSQNAIDDKVKKELLVKYNLGLSHYKPVEINGITSDLNKHTLALKQELAKNALTLLKNTNSNLFPLSRKKKIAYIGVGTDIRKPNAFANRLKEDYNADVYTWDYKRDLGTLPMTLATIKDKNYDAVVLGVHNYSRRPANNYGLSYASIDLINQLQQIAPTLTFIFGNPYAISNFNEAGNLIAAYEDDEITQSVAVDMLEGKVVPEGELPVTVNQYLSFGTGIKYHSYFPKVDPEIVGMSSEKLRKIDDIVAAAIKNKAMPGAVVLAAKDGKVFFEKAYGTVSITSDQPVTTDMAYDLASVTKVSATTPSIMKLYEEGKLDLDKTLGDYLPWTRGSDKAPLKIRDVLLHEAGLVAYIPFYNKTLDSKGIPKPEYYQSEPSDRFPIRVAENLYLRSDYQDTMYKTILESKLGPAHKYVYSDNDFIFLAKVVEAISGMPVNEYAKKNFYDPLNMSSTGFLPRQHLPLNQIAPTETEKTFRVQTLRGDVHDPGAALFGGVAGHAGLFSNAYDLAQLYQMILNGGEMNGMRFLKKETIDLFTAYNSDISRRGLGYDKPEKDNATRKEPYPSASASPATFGHTGFTGTCVWVDPKYNIVYIFLSNRVNEEGDDQNNLGRQNIRPKIQEAIYDALINR